MLQAVIRDGLIFIAVGIQAIAGLIVGIAALTTAFRLISLPLVGKTTHRPTKEAIRLSFSKWLALALEFEVGADIVLTAVAPTWSDIGKLSALILLRTLLNFFLEQEIDRYSQRQPHGPTVRQ